MSSRKTGAKGVAQAIKYYSDLDYAVFVPVSDVSRYDLIVDTGERILRVEVKSATNGSVDLRSISPYSTGKRYRVISSKDCDEVFCYNISTENYKVLSPTEFDGLRQVTVH